MREIKFRFYSTRLRKMSPNTTMDGLLQSPVLRLLGNGMEDLIAMQYTGRHDKRGAEIYEADILHWHGQHFICTWEEVTARFRLVPCSPRLNTTLTMSNAWKAAVIGNAYDNPELTR